MEKLLKEILEKLNTLLANNTTLTNTNAELVHVNKEAIQMARIHQDLLPVSYEIYQTLHDNPKRSIQEEVWYLGLHEVLIAKSSSKNQ